MCSSNRETLYNYYKSPIGLVEIGGTALAVTTLSFVDQRRTPCTSTPVVDQAIQQVEAYFVGKLSEFDVPLALQGTPFQQAVWQLGNAYPALDAVGAGDTPHDQHCVMRVIARACITGHSGHR